MTPAGDLYASAILLTFAMLLLVLTTVKTRRDQRRQRDLAEQIKLLMEDELEIITHFRHVTQDLIRVQPERAEVLEVVDLELAARHEWLTDARSVLAAAVAGKWVEELRRMREVRSKYPEVWRAR